tara:strand:- start:99 stop:992 length:894 start_codon:yes stop_codon:yes gene_type:complete
MNFNVIDVETANRDYSSICQVAVVSVRDGEIVSSWESLVNPETIFDHQNISIHKISPESVIGSPNFLQIYEDLVLHTQNYPLIHHGAFDRIAINRACDLYSLDRPEIYWLDSTQIVRRVWKEFSTKGYGLKNLANHFNFEFIHHNALEDSTLTAKVVIKACSESKTTIKHWNSFLAKTSDSVKSAVTSSPLKRKIQGNENGPLYGENLVITGELSYPRNKIAKVSTDAGCTVTNSVSKKTTLLVVGSQNDYRLSGYGKSVKFKKAEELIEKGIPIRIITENDLFILLNKHGFRLDGD